MTQKVIEKEAYMVHTIELDKPDYQQLQRIAKSQGKTEKAVIHDLIEQSDEKEWDNMVSSSRSKKWLSDMAKQVDKEYKSGLTEEGGWDNL